MAITTRSKSNIYLVGDPIEHFIGTMLPTARQVLQVYFFNHRVAELSQKDSVQKVVREICEIWSKARVPTSQERNIIAKLNSLLERYRNILRNKGRKGPAQAAKESDFEQAIHQLFDIAHHEATDIIKIEEDKTFLNDQRTCRKMYMGGIDKNLSEREERKRKRIQKQNERLVKEDRRKEQMVTNTSDSDTSLLSESDDSDEKSNDEIVKKEEQKRSKNREKNKILKKKAIGTEVSSALDRCNVSSRSAGFILQATAKSFGHDLSDIALSVSSIHRNRSKHRRQISAQVKDSFITCGPLVIHFDGKLLPAISGPGKEDRVAVLVTGNETEKLLGIPKVGRGSGEELAKAAYELIIEWNLVDKISAISFDTTAANTGCKNGACTLLQNKLGKALLCLACRHHIYEVVCGDVFKAIFPHVKTSGPGVELFHLFKDFWPNIDQNLFKPCSDSRLSGCLCQQKSEAVQFCRSILTSEADSLPREDYRELLELTLIFLGEIPPCGIRFRAPGAYHHARWMSKVLYILKLNLFRDQFPLETTDCYSCLEMGLFIALIYCKAWTTCTSSCDAPENDLRLIKLLTEYKNINEAIAMAGLRAMKRHLWYLGQELAPLALFSNIVPSEVKAHMVHSLKTLQSSESAEVRSIRYTGEEEDLSNKSLDYFLGQSSHLFFQLLQLDSSFLERDVLMWADDAAYQKAKEVILSLKVVNDSAERSIALATTFNSSITKREEEKQILFQVVEMHRKKYPYAKKSGAVSTSM